MFATSLVLLLAGADPEPNLPLGVSLNDCRKELRHAQAEKRRVAAVRLGWLGPRAAPAVPELTQALRDSDGAVRLEACNTLARIGRAAVPSLAGQLSDRSPLVRWQALEVLGRLGPEARGAVAALGQQAMYESSITLRIQAVQALGRLGASARPALPALLHAASDRAHLHTTGIRWSAAHPSSVSETALLAIRRIDPTLSPLAARTALPVLHAMLGSEPFGDRLTGARGLALLGAHAAPVRADLRAALIDQRTEMRSLVAALAGIGSTGQADLLDLIESDRRDLAWRRQVLQALANASVPLAPEAVRRLSALLKHADSGLRAHAARALSSPAALPALARALADPLLARPRADGSLWGQMPGNLAAEALSRLGKKAVPALIDALEIDARRMQAIIALGRIGRPASAARPALRRLLAHRDGNVRIEAAGALLRLGENPSTPARILTAGLEADATRAHALRIILVGGTPLHGEGPALLWMRVPGSAVPLPRAGAERLVDLLSVPELASSAAVALEGSRAHARFVVPRLATLLRSAKEAQRSTILHALAALGPAVGEVMPALLRELQTKDALHTLRKIGPGARAATPYLLELIQGKDRDARQQALYTLAAIRPDSREAVNVLVAILTSKGKAGTRDDTGRAEAAHALGIMGPAARAAIPALQSTLLHPDSLVRLDACFALARITGELGTYVPLLVLAGTDVYDEDDRYSVAPQLCAALEELGAQAAPALPWLLRQLEDTGHARDDQERQMDALRVLAAIGPAARAALPRLGELASHAPAPVAEYAATVARRLAAP